MQPHRYQTGICSLSPSSQLSVGRQEGNLLLQLREPVHNDNSSTYHLRRVPVYISLVPWLSALQAVGLVRWNVNRKLVLATHIISVKHAKNYNLEFYLSFSLPVAILFLVAGIDALVNVGHD